MGSGLKMFKKQEVLAPKLENCAFCHQEFDINQRDNSGDMRPSERILETAFDMAKDKMIRGSNSFPTYNIVVAHTFVRNLPLI